MVEMNGAFHAPPLTTPPSFALRSSRRASPKVLAHPLRFWAGAGCRNWSQFETNYDRAMESMKALQFHVFYDTILILRKQVTKNKRRNINIFAKVFPAKSPQIHPHILEFVEWE